MCEYWLKLGLCLADISASCWRNWTVGPWLMSCLLSYPPHTHCSHPESFTASQGKSSVWAKKPTYGGHKQTLLEMLNHSPPILIQNVTRYFIVKFTVSFRHQLRFIPLTVWERMLVTQPIANFFSFFISFLLSVALGDVMARGAYFQTCDVAKVNVLRKLVDLCDVTCCVCRTPPTMLCDVTCGHVWCHLYCVVWCQLFVWCHRSYFYTMQSISALSVPWKTHNYYGIDYRGQRWMW